MEIFLWIILVLFGLKVLNNFVSAYMFLKQREGEGFSILPVLVLDFVLVLLLSFASVFVEVDYWAYGFWGTLLATFGLVVFSYLHFFVVVMIGGAIAKKRGNGGLETK